MRTLLISVAATLLLSGCMMGPDYVRPPVDSPAAWRVNYADAADTANIRWWELFNDPALNQLVDTALSENKDVRIAAARVEEFAARVDISRAGYFPQIGYDGEASRNRVSREVYGGGDWTSASTTTTPPARVWAGNSTCGAASATQPRRRAPSCWRRRRTAGR